MSYLAIIMQITTSISATISITSDHVGNIFTDDESIQFQVHTTTETNLSVIDYYEQVVFEAKINVGTSKMEIGKLPRSHYIIINGENGEPDAYFSVIPSLGNRPQIEDSRIASDLATSWLVERDQFDNLAWLTRLSGQIWVRDRIHWSEMETQRGNWVEHTKYDSAAEIQIKHGLKVYQVFHNTPTWAQEEAESRSFPDDLRDAFNFAVGVTHHFGEKVVAWEIWNEPDILVFSTELGDSYSALLKTMYLGYKSADPDLPVLLCSFAMPPGKFTELVFQNDIGNYYDIYNYHIYGEWRTHADRALKHIDVMRRNQDEHKPIWLTEAGRPITREPDKVELTLEQGRDVANFLPKAITSSLSAGVDKYFWFILPYYRERDKMLFGLLRQDLTPTAGYSSLSACTFALGAANYLGRLDVKGVHAHAFDRGDGNIVLSFWSADDKEEMLGIQADAESATLINLMGIEKGMVLSNGSLEIKATSSVSYLILPGDSLKDDLVVDYPRAKSEIKPYNPDKLSHIVLRLQFPREIRNKKLETYLLPGNSTTKASIEVYNFGSKQFSGKLGLQLPEGYAGKLGAAEISIDPMGRTVEQLELSPGSEANTNPEELRVDLLNASNEIETSILAWVAAKPD